jgi:hypothetical protein
MGDIAAKRSAPQSPLSLPAIDAIVAIAEQHGVVIHPPAGSETKGAATAPAHANA